MPTLQIECHGSRDREGLVLNVETGECVTWDELRQAVLPINVACNLNLIILVSACYGAHAFGKLMVDSVTNAEPAACWGVWGPTKEITAAAIESTVLEFYKELFSANPERHPLMSLLIAGHRYDSFFSSAQTCFDKAEKMYYKNHCSKRQMQKRAKKLADNARAESGESKSTKEIEQFLRIKQDEYFRDCRRKFFLIDQYPQILAPLKINA